MLFLDTRPQLSADGSLVVFVRILDDSTRILLASLRSADGTWSAPATVLTTTYSVDLLTVARAPTGEALLMYSVRLFVSQMSLSLFSVNMLAVGGHCILNVRDERDWFMAVP